MGPPPPYHTERRSPLRCSITTPKRGARLQRSCWLAFCPLRRSPLNSPCFLRCAPTPLSLAAPLRGVAGALALAMPTCGQLRERRCDGFGLGMMRCVALAGWQADQRNAPPSVCMHLDQPRQQRRPAPAYPRPLPPSRPLPPPTSGPSP